MLKYCILFLLFGCVGTEKDFQNLFKSTCGEELSSHAPLTCNGEAFIPKLLKSKEPLVKTNYDVLENFIGNYTVKQLKMTFEDGDNVWTLALKAGAEKLYQGLTQVQGLDIDRLKATKIFYEHSPEMFVGYRNFSGLMIDPSMELFLAGNGKNPHSLLPLSNTSKDILLKYLHEERSLAPIANLFYSTNVLKDAELVRDLEPYFHLSMPFPPKLDLSVSLGALVARKWVFQMKQEFFVETDAFFDPLALAIYEGMGVTEFLPFTTRSSALKVAYALLDDSQIKILQKFSFENIELLSPHPSFKEIKNAKSSVLEDHLIWKMHFENRSYKNLRSMILAIEQGNHNYKLMNFFWQELNRFIQKHGIYPAFGRFIGHELRPIEGILLEYGMNLEKLIPKYTKHLKKLDDFGKGPR